MNFVGLPSPAAAGVIVSLVIFYENEAPQLNAILLALPFCAIAAAVLMVSRIQYPHVLNQYLRGKKPFSHFIRVLLLLGLVWWRMQTALAIAFCAFAASGVLRRLYGRVVPKKAHPPVGIEPAGGGP
jgi:CDP-diacylglycerol--serine O-phosphatidyltransferase